MAFKMEEMFHFHLNVKLAGKTCFIHSDAIRDAEKLSSVFFMSENQLII